MRIWAGAYQWRTDPGFTGWFAPDGVTGGIDLRTPAEMAQSGGVAPMRALFVTPDAVMLPVPAVQIASDPEETLSPAALAVLRTMAGVATSDETKLDRLVWELLTHRGDLTGARLAPTLMPTAAGRLELHFAGHTRREPIDFGSPTWTVLQQRFHAQYRTYRTRALAGAMPTNFHRSVLTVWCEKFRLDPSREASWARFIPNDLQRESPLPHNTTLTESFNTADSATLGPDLAWTEYSVNGGAPSSSDEFEVVSNACACDQARSVGSTAVEGSDLSSDDHYAQLSITAIASGATNVQIGPCCRHSSNGLEIYGARALQINDTYEVFKIVSGTFTGLDSAAAITISAPQTAKVQASGSTLTAHYDGVQTHNFTDTAITTHTRAGIFAFNNNVNTTDCKCDAWQAEDVAGGGSSIAALQTYYRRRRV